MDVSVITVTWNSARFIGEQIVSVGAGCMKSSFEHFIVDNHSADATTALIRKKFPQVKLLPQNTNKGFGAANNLAAAVATGRYFLLINPDMRVAPGSIDAAVAWADAHPRAGVVGVRLTNPTGEVNANTAPRRFPTVFEEVALNIKLPWLFASLLKRYMARDLDLQKEQTVDSVQGSFMLVRRSVYEKLGHLFDPKYFIWFEDVDLCREVKRIGLEVWYVPSITCVDFGSQSFKLRRPVWKQKAFIKSQLIYFKKWGPAYAQFLIYCSIPLSMFIALVRSLFV